MAEVEASDVTPPEVATTPEGAQPPEVVVSNTPTPKKPRKPRPPKIVAKLATVTENSTPGDVADVELRPSKEAQLPLEFWAGLMQSQKVIMARRKSERYNSFRIT